MVRKETLVDKKRILLEKEINGVSYGLFNRRTPVTLTFKDGTKFETSRRKLATAIKRKLVSEHNLGWIGQAFRQPVL